MLISESEVEWVPVVQRHPSFSDFWNGIKKLPVSSMLNYWLNTFPDNTKRNYTTIARDFFRRNILHPDELIEDFAGRNHETYLDGIKNIKELKESTRQLRAAAYCSFTGFVCRHTRGIVPKAMPCKHGKAKTFFRTNEKVVTEAMTQAEWIKLFKVLSIVNPRDVLFCKMMLHGGKRFNEVQRAQIQDINWETNSINFDQSKSACKVILNITFPVDYMFELKDYLQGRLEGNIFVTSNGKPLDKMQIHKTMKKSAKMVGIKKNVSSHSFRASLVTYLKDNGFDDCQIMKITGHKSSASVQMYDKTSQAKNLSKEIRLW